MSFLSAWGAKMNICTKLEMIYISHISIRLYLEEQIQEVIIDQEYCLILKSFYPVAPVVEETAPWGSHGHLKGHHHPRVEMGEICPTIASVMGHYSLSLVFSLVYFVFVDEPL